MPGPVFWCLLPSCLCSTFYSTALLNRSIHVFILLSLTIIQQNIKMNDVTTLAEYLLSTLMETSDSFIV